MEDIQVLGSKIFGDADKNILGKVKSEYPVWYMERHIEELVESIDSMKRRLNRGEVPANAIGGLKAELYRAEEKLETIQKNIPTLSVGERERLGKLWKEELCPKIEESLFTRTQMMKGLADAHEEARRMVQPIIPVSKELEGFMVMCGCKVVNHKASRNALAKAFKLTGRLLGEYTNIETLRKD